MVADSKLGLTVFVENRIISDYVDSKLLHLLHVVIFMN